MNTTATTRTVVSHRDGNYIIRHRYESPDGSCVTHRTDGPALIGFYPNDNNAHLVTIWARHGRQKRTDGPATIEANGDIYWDVNGNDIAALDGHNNGGDS